MNNDTSEDESDELAVPSSQMKEGMVLARDLVAKDGILLLSKGISLDAKLIKKIVTFEKLVNEQLTVHVSRQ